MLLKISRRSCSMGSRILLLWNSYPHGQALCYLSNTAAVRYFKPWSCNCETDNAIWLQYITKNTGCCWERIKPKMDAMTHHLQVRLTRAQERERERENDDVRCTPDELVWYRLQPGLLHCSAPMLPNCGLLVERVGIAQLCCRYYCYFGTAVSAEERQVAFEWAACIYCSACTDAELRLACRVGIAQLSRHEQRCMRLHRLMLVSRWTKIAHLMHTA
jgi:hypothetical protein